MMAGTFLGAVPEELDALANAFTAHAGHLSDLGSQVGAALAGTTWLGADLDDFQGHWIGELRPAMVAASRSLDNAAGILHQQAREQRRASADSGWQPPKGLASQPFTTVSTGGLTAIGGAAVLTGVLTSPGPAPTNPGDPPGAPGGKQFVIGPPTKPPFSSPDDFTYDPKASANFSDWLSWEKWRAEAVGAMVLRPDLSDATTAYAHYLDLSGTALTVDYAKAYHDDSAIHTAVDGQVSQARAAADQIAQSGNSSFSITGDATSMGQLGLYPTTEDWQKTLGDHQIWTSGNVTVANGVATMVVTVHAVDRYNFNHGMQDIASGAPDDQNGRFATLGWAKNFDTNGQLTETVSWKVGNPGVVTVVVPPKPISGRGR